MGCYNSHIENDLDFFIDKIFSTFPLKITTYEQLEDIYEKHITSYNTHSNFLEIFEKIFHSEFNVSPYKSYHLFIIEIIVTKLNQFQNDENYFKYNFLLLIFPLLNHSIGKHEVIDNFKDIIVNLIDFKKPQIEIVKKMQYFLNTFLNFILYDVLIGLSKIIKESNNSDKIFLDPIKNKIEFINVALTFFLNIFILLKTFKLHLLYALYK